MFFFCSLNKRYSFAVFLLSVIAASSVLWTVTRNPIHIIYASNYLLTRCIRTPPVLSQKDEYFAGVKDFENAHTQLKSEITTFLDEHEYDLPLTKDTYDGQNDYIGSDVRVEKEQKQEEEEEEEEGKPPKKIGWRIFTVSTGKHISKHARVACPTLVQLLEKYEGQILSCVISVLPSKTKIPIHVGYSKQVVRGFLPIEVPKDEENVFLCVNGQKQLFQEGVFSCWDDTFPHKVYNNTNERRVVIYMDIFRDLKSSIKNKISRFFVNKMLESDVVKEEIKQTERLIRMAS
jgi:hypothetical protein